MANTWVDFRTIKQTVSMRMVLDHYQVQTLKLVHDELRGRCPIHKGEGVDAFHASVEKNCFQCFACKAHGNVLDFVAAMEKCSARDAAVTLAEWFSGSATDGNREGPEPAAAAAAASGGEATPENKRLGFELKGVDPSHEYFRKRGVTQNTTELFGAGFFAGKGSMSGRVVIPIHDSRGELLAYAGRSIDGSEPKYKLPSGFQKSLELYNLHRVLEGRAEQVVIVEGFFDCMKVWQAGFPVVALMGSSLSEQQEKCLCGSFKMAALFFDGDEAGRGVTEDCLRRLGRKLWVRAVELTDGSQPDMLSELALEQLLSGGEKTIEP